MDGRKTRLAPDFRDLLRACVAHDVRFLVVGVYALAVPGRPRATTGSGGAAPAAMPLAVLLSASGGRLDVGRRRRVHGCRHGREGATTDGRESLPGAGSGSGALPVGCMAYFPRLLKRSTA